MQNTLSIRYAFCACAYGVLCYLEPSVVFKAKVAPHVRIKFRKFDEKRAITPKWVMGFTSKLQGR